MGFNGTKNARYDAPFAFYMSYLETKKQARENSAMKLDKADRCPGYFAYPGLSPGPVDAQAARW